jgi:hypothetical protein
LLDLKAPIPSEEQKFQLNDQALNCIYETLDPKVWKMLEEAYDGTSTIKDARLYLFKDKHAKFKMFEGGNEPARDVFHRLNVIVNELRALGTRYG